jgi:hypothetical protein
MREGLAENEEEEEREKATDREERVGRRHSAVKGERER